MSTLYHTLSLFQYYVRHLHVSLGLLIESRRYYLCFHASGHICYFFRTLINKQNNEVALRVIFCYSIGYLLQQYGFTRFGLSHNHSPLSFTNWSKHVQNTGRHKAWLGAQLKLFLREKWSQVFKRYSVSDFLCGFSVYRLNTQ